MRRFATLQPGAVCVDSATLAILDPYLLSRSARAEMSVIAGHNLACVIYTGADGLYPVSSTRQGIVIRPGLFTESMHSLWGHDAKSALLMSGDTA